MQIPVSYDRMGNALFRGGYADVWKGKHCDQDVAVKVIRTYSNSDLQRIVGVNYSPPFFLCASADGALRRDSAKKL